MNQIQPAKPGTRCLKCGIDILKHVYQGRMTDGQLHKGQIMLCSACGAVQILGDADWRPLERKDFEALSPQDKRRLLYTAQILRTKVGTSNPWTPYDQQEPGKS